MMPTPDHINPAVRCSQIFFVAGVHFDDCSTGKLQVKRYQAIVKCERYKTGKEAKRKISSRRCHA
jgi:hypothetical protein